ncbi:D-glycerate dehydrogenase [Candidatus Woesebacteria bacterium]|nr:D-glycerate dehydrogenase [Candidatus Woesebacteria bacterium]QQG47585.1 MAG: D-glycerate dehydrogenase [Candidatus Woesebacteria bacterium]
MKIVVTRKIPGNFLEKLKEGNDVWISSFDRPLTEEELISNGKGADVLLSLLTDHIDGEMMDAIGPNLKLISNYAVGFDNIDVEAAKSRGILVCNTPSDDVNEAVAEHTWALLMSLSRRIVEANYATKNGAYKGWEPDIFLGTTISGKTLGIIGLGRIGTMVAKKAQGMGVDILYTKRNPDPEANSSFKFVSMDELLSQSDFVSLHVPLTDETRHMINGNTLSKMKTGAYLINTARGPVVDEHELVDALRSGHLGGAALDVFDNEPEINPELIGMPNVILTPHIASATHEARNKMGEMAINAIIDFASDRKPSNLVNNDTWDNRRK